ncbi:hypothetical protein HO173_007689 [Letharia columbiana]|uniref:Uncharacterized protein n=1 Tax=Letharia columbiana TaxID=112416 RepID=A0A8H6FT32_9LECA|nr:uncharacterized protein HO173_007689 [Letharia columbiana]KAF6234267.1 hypothetical protein HO173_007689 [Letharia columbiana]
MKGRKTVYPGLPTGDLGPCNPRGISKQGGLIMEAIPPGLSMQSSQDSLRPGSVKG